MASLVPLPKFYATDNNGRPVPGGLLFTYEAGTTTKLDTYTTSSGGVANTNPVEMDSAGRADVWIDGAKLYKWVFSPADDTDPPTNPFWTVDNVGFTADGMQFKSTASGAVPRTVRSKLMDIVSMKDFGVAPDNGVEDATLAFTRCQGALSVKGGMIFYPQPSVHYLHLTPINGTVAAAGTCKPICVVGSGTNVNTPSIVFKHTGHGFDMSGAIDWVFRDLNIGSDATTTPQTAFFLARNSANSGAGRHRFENVRVFGPFTKSIIYNYGSEENEYIGLYLHNTYDDGAANVVTLSAYNIDALSSTFLTIATGAQSTLENNFWGGSYFMQSAHVDADVFLLDGVSSVRWYGSWMRCSSAAAKGRALIHVNTANAASDSCIVNGVRGENSDFNADYFIYIGDTARTLTGWRIEGCRVAVTTRSIFAYANVTIDDFHIAQISEQAAKGVEIVGTMQTSYFNDNDLALIVGTDTNNFLTGAQSNWTITTSTASNHINTGALLDWTPNTSALTVTGTLTTVAKYQRAGRDAEFTLELNAVSSIVCAAATAVTGLPIATAFEGGICQVSNASTAEVIGHGVIVGTTLHMPAVNVTTAKVLVRGIYPVA